MLVTLFSFIVILSWLSAFATIEHPDSFRFLVALVLGFLLRVGENVPSLQVKATAPAMY
jgi:hypothetical protein